MMLQHTAQCGAEVVVREHRAERAVQDLAAGGRETLPGRDVVPQLEVRLFEVPDRDRLRRGRGPRPSRRRRR